METNETNSAVDKREVIDSPERRNAKKKAISSIIILGIALAAVLAATTFLLKPVVPIEYLQFLHVAEVAVVGFLAIKIIGSASHNLTLSHSEPLAKSIRILVSIAGAIIVIAVIISYLSQDPVIAAAIATISGLVIGFSSSNIIGNAIAGLYLAMARPFWIGDRIKIYDETGVVYDIGLLYTRMLMPNGDIMLASNSSMLSTHIVLRVGKTAASEEADPAS
ncbi:MAG: mechanosensitive ion channel domain-containing protein [Nitrososphaerales archaeon]